MMMAKAKHSGFTNWWRRRSFQSQRKDKTKSTTSMVKSRITEQPISNERLRSRMPETPIPSLITVEDITMRESLSVGARDKRNDLPSIQSNWNGCERRDGWQGNEGNYFNPGIPFVLTPYLSNFSLM